MSKNQKLCEFIINFGLFILAFLAGIFIIKDLIAMLPLFKCYSLSENELDTILNNGIVGQIYHEIGQTEFVNFQVVMNVIGAFFNNLNIAPILFLIFFAILLCLKFIFINWNFLSKKLLIFTILLVSFIGKYLLFAISILIFYKGSYSSLCLGLIFGIILYVIFAIIEFSGFIYLISNFIYEGLKNIKTLKTQFFLL